MGEREWEGHCLPGYSLNIINRHIFSVMLSVIMTRHIFSITLFPIVILSIYTNDKILVGVYRGKYRRNILLVKVTVLYRCIFTVCICVCIWKSSSSNSLINLLNLYISLIKTSYDVGKRSHYLHGWWHKVAKTIRLYIPFIYII